MKGRTALLVIVFLVAAGCQDSTSTPGPSDAGDSTDQPPPTTLIPSSVPEASICRDGWCWLKPSPSGHAFSDLIADDGEIRGVAQLDYRNQPRPMVWSDRLQILDSPLPDDVQLEDMTTTPDGWLALEESSDEATSQTVYSLSRTEVRTTVDLDALELVRIDGISAENFVATNDSGNGAVMYNGELKQGNLQRTKHPDYKIWRNGELWKFMPSDSEAPVFAEAETFPETPPGTVVSPLALGPGPHTDCADQGFWTAIDLGDVLHWSPSEESWTLEGRLDHTITDIGCDDGAAISVDEVGRFLTRSEGQWVPESITARHLNSVAIQDGVPHIAGEGGTRIEIEGDEVRHATEHLEPLHREGSGAGSRRFSKFWINDEETELIAVVYRGVFRKSDESWERMPTPDGFQGTADSTKILGDDAPNYMTDSGDLYEWTGTEWSSVPLVDEDENLYPFQDIAESAQGTPWVAAESRLFRRADSGWVEVSVQNDSIGEISDILAGADGRLLVSGESDVYRLTGQPGNWSTEPLESYPCEEPTSMYRAPDESLYIAGSHGCFGHLSGGNWTTFEANFEIKDTSVKPKLTVNRFVPRPDHKHPLLVTHMGLVSMEEGGTLELTFRGLTQDAIHLESAGATLMGHQQGFMVKYH